MCPCQANIDLKISNYEIGKESYEVASFALHFGAGTYLDYLQIREEDSLLWVSRGISCAWKSQKIALMMLSKDKEQWLEKEEKVK